MRVDSLRFAVWGFRDSGLGFGASVHHVTPAQEVARAGGAAAE